MSNAAPIGVFDSGIGGLTVARELIRQLSSESIIYVGDTARVPYGPKSPDTVRRYSREVTGFLLDQGVKAVVVACNTATAHALEVLIEELPLPVVGVVEPGARAAVEASTTGNIGVIGTVGTIRSCAYECAIRALHPAVQITPVACPLFVPLIEEGWVGHAVTRQVAEEYLAPLQRVGIDTLVLGCTHYPLLKPLLAELLGPSVQLIDSGQKTAAEVGRVLERAGLRAGEASAPAHRFYATDDPQQMLRLGQRFLGGAVERVETLSLG